MRVVSKTISKTQCALWSKQYMPPSTPLHPQVAELVAKLATITATATELVNVVSQREMKIAEAVMELQKEDFDKARVIRLLS